MPRQIARTGRSRRTASRISGSDVASRSGSCRISGWLGSHPYWLGCTFEGLPVSNSPSSLSSSPRISTRDPTAGINTGRHPVASITALGYLSATPWMTLSLIVRVQLGIPISDIWRTGICSCSGFVLAAGGGIWILIYKQLRVERYTELFSVERNCCRFALLINDRPLPQRNGTVAENHSQTAAIRLSVLDHSDPQGVSAPLEARHDEIAEGDRVPEEQPRRRRLQSHFGHLNQLLVDVIHIEHVGKQKYRRGRIVLEAHSAGSCHP